MFGSEIVRSADKEVGWATYISQLDTLLANPQPASVELRHIHALMTSEAVADLTEDSIQNCFQAQLCTLDRPDGREKSAALKQIYDANTRRYKTMHPYDMFDELTQAYKAICTHETEIQLDVHVPGALRTLGQRRINNGEWHTVYFAHTCAYDDEHPGSMAVEELFPKTYFGLSTNLEKVYGSFCTTYDALRSQAGDSLDEQLLAEAFFSTLGTRILHPFWDGNGRAFAGHALLALERAGIPAREKNPILDAMPALTLITEHFLEYVLATAGLDFIRGNETFSMYFNHDYRADYMQRLNTKLNTLVQDACNPDTIPIDYYSNAAWQIKKALFNQQLLTPTNQDQRRLTIETNKCAAIPEEDRPKAVILIPHRIARTL
jgi:hypothetical protein